MATVLKLSNPDVEQTLKDVGRFKLMAITSQ